MLSAIGWVIVATSVIAIPIVAIYLFRTPVITSSGRLSVHQLGQYEAGLPRLRRVVVVCHRIEDPKDSLRDAVKFNFARNVQYLFLVSESRVLMERDRGYRIFEVLARLAFDEQQGSSRKISELLEIKALPYEWDDTPYIFYELLEPDRPDVRRIVAVRGNQIKEGIADGYSKVDPRSARSIFRAVMEGAPIELVDGVPIETVEYGEPSYLKDFSNAVEKQTAIH